jgi:hypothetical protein
MSVRLEELACEKELLLARSALYRLRLRRATHEVTDALNWKRMIVAAAAVPAARRIGFGIVLSLVGLRAGTRAVVLAGRIALAAKLARSLISYARAPAPASGCADEQTETAVARIFRSSPRSPK